MDPPCSIQEGLRGPPSGPLSGQGFKGNGFSPASSDSAYTQQANNSASDQERDQQPSSPGVAAEGLASHVLPRGSRVLIHGNNRTASRLLGLQGSVRRSVGLGGWHWLVLSTGEEVKLQRNALTVLEYGDAADDSDAESDRPTREAPEIITRPRVRRPPRSLSPMPEIRKKASYGVRTPSPALSVDLHKLCASSLQRYSNKYNLGLMESLDTREDMLHAVAEHFKTQDVSEGDVLASFVVEVRRRRQMSVPSWAATVEA